MKTQTEIVIETIQHYLPDPLYRRGKKPTGECLYHVPALFDVPERHCAVGRCMTAESLAAFGGFHGDVEALETKLGDTLDTLLREEYCGHSQEFWSNLQSLHDRDYNWLPGDEGACYRGEFLRDIFPDAVQRALDLGLIK